MEPFSDTLGTASSVLIKEEVSSYQGQFCTLFYVDVAGTMHGVLIKGDVLISGVSLQRGSTVATVVFRVSPHGRLNIHCDFGPHGRLPGI